MTIFFLADSHFSHVNICGPTLTKWKSGFRNFASLEEMNTTIINNINKVVGPNDILYHLGDFSFGDKSRIPEYRAAINCNTIRLLYGNHDGHLHKDEYRSLFDSRREYAEFRAGKTLITLCHYPIASWNEVGRGSINLHGHCHGNHAPQGKQMDVGVDPLNFHPICLDEVMERLKDVPPIYTDHHGEVR